MPPPTAIFLESGQARTVSINLCPGPPLAP
jgi:hypothetical protein